jgi:hypothetical protein
MSRARRAAAGPLLAGVPVAVADIASFGRVQSKVEFARLIDELGLPQPRWRLVADQDDLAGLPFPYWLKTAFSTAGRGVRLVTDERSKAAAGLELFEDVAGTGMAQEPAGGQYGQVQGLFDQGRLVAVHTSVQVGTGIGPSAAARLSVDHPQPRRDIAMLGEALTWHGGLTIDYLHQHGAPAVGGELKPSVANRPVPAARLGNARGADNFARGQSVDDAR